MCWDTEDLDINGLVISLEPEVGHLNLRIYYQDIPIYGLSDGVITEYYKESFVGKETKVLIECYKHVSQSYFFFLTHKEKFSARMEKHLYNKIELLLSQILDWMYLTISSLAPFLNVPKYHKDNDLRLKIAKSRLSADPFEDLAEPIFTNLTADNETGNGENAPSGPKTPSTVTILTGGFPFFANDYKKLSGKWIEPAENDMLLWKGSKVSLAEYFAYRSGVYPADDTKDDDKKSRNPKIDWKMIETYIRYKKGRLRGLKNSLSSARQINKQSRDFDEIKTLFDSTPVSTE